MSRRRGVLRNGEGAEQDTLILIYLPWPRVDWVAGPEASPRYPRVSTTQRAGLHAGVWRDTGDLTQSAAHAQALHVSRLPSR